MSEDRRRSVEAYDSCAGTYAEITRNGHPETREALRRFADAVGEGARVLEVASGPGWDADFLESRGVTVRRTDLSEGFIGFQTSRGKTVERLDLLDGDLGGSWDGLVGLYVLQHVARVRTDEVVARMAAALRRGGVLLISFQEGEAEDERAEAEGGISEPVRRSQEEMRDAVERGGLEIVSWHGFEGREADWVLLIAYRP